MHFCRIVRTYVLTANRGLPDERYVASALSSAVSWGWAVALREYLKPFQPVGSAVVGLGGALLLAYGIIEPIWTAITSPVPNVVWQLGGALLIVASLAMMHYHHVRRSEGRERDLESAISELKERSTLGGDSQGYLSITEEIAPSQAEREAQQAKVEAEITRDNALEQLRYLTERQPIETLRKFWLGDVASAFGLVHEMTVLACHSPVVQAAPFSGLLAYPHREFNAHRTAFAESVSESGTASFSETKGRLRRLLKAYGELTFWLHQAQRTGYRVAKADGYGRWAELHKKFVAELEGVSKLSDFPELADLLANERKKGPDEPNFLLDTKPSNT